MLNGLLFFKEICRVKPGPRLSHVIRSSSLVPECAREFPEMTGCFYVAPNSEPALKSLLTPEFRLVLDLINCLPFFFRNWKYKQNCDIWINKWLWVTFLDRTSAPYLQDSKFHSYNRLRRVKMRVRQVEYLQDLSDGRLRISDFQISCKWLYIFQTSEWYIRTSDCYNQLARRESAFTIWNFEAWSSWDHEKMTLLAKDEKLIFLCIHAKILENKVRNEVKMFILWANFPVWSPSFCKPVHGSVWIRARCRHRTQRWDRKPVGPWPGDYISKTSSSYNIWWYISKSHIPFWGERFLNLHTVPWCQFDKRPKCPRITLCRQSTNVNNHVIWVSATFSSTQAWVSQFSPRPPGQSQTSSPRHHPSTPAVSGLPSLSRQRICPGKPALLLQHEQCVHICEQKYNRTYL